MAQLRTFLRDFDLGGRQELGFDAQLCGRLARALCGLLARRQISAGPLVVGREANVDVALRDGLVQGAAISGASVIDLGKCGAGEHEQSLSAYGARAGVFLSAEDEGMVSAAIFIGGVPLTGEALEQLCRVEESGCFPSGEGAIAQRPPLASADAGHRTHVDTQAPVQDHISEAN